MKKIINSTILILFSIALSQYITYAMDVAQRPGDFLFVSAYAEEDNAVESNGSSVESEKPAYTPQATPASRVADIEATGEHCNLWIEIPEVTMSEAVVHSQDNYEYLHTNASNEADHRGALFVDCRNSYDLLANANTVVYGHHFNGEGTKFSKLPELLDGVENKSIFICDKNRVYEYRIFCVRFTTTADSAIAFQDQTWEPFELGSEEYKNAITEWRATSDWVDASVTVDENDHVLTLSTCYKTNINKHNRCLVQAVLVDDLY